MLQLRSVNVSLPKEIEVRGKTIRTGIFKEPVDGPVAVKRLNLAGDGQADLIGHGGEQRAVYVYSYDNYGHWERELGRDDFSWGQFGENFTVDGMRDEQIHVGDRFRIGTALFEVSQPRVPCFKLAIKMNVDDFYRRILESGRLGFYFRVLEEGQVEAGDEIQPVHRDPRQINIVDMNALMYFDKENLAGMERALEIEALSPGWRSTFEERLTAARQSPATNEPFRTLVVMRSEPESDTIRSFYLQPADDEPLSPFLPGQFLPIRLDIPGQYRPVLRTYSLSDSPTENHYRLSIKRELAPPDRPDLYPGVASHYFHEQIQVGSHVQAKAPRGKFHLDVESSLPVVLLSAGVGLTPLVSMLNSLAASGSDRPTWFIHGARNGGEHAFGERVRELADQHGSIQTHIRYSQPRPEDVQGQHHDDQGYVDAPLVQRLVGNPDCDFYLCGPGPFMESMFAGLLDWGVDESRIHYEFFGPATVMQGRSSESTPSSSQTSAEREDLEVRFAKSEMTVAWDPSLESLLDLAEAHGLTPDYSCRSGVCHTCVRGLVEGEVEYIQEPLDPPAADSVLICCAKPKTRVVIDL